MRISDWSSDVCSSDLKREGPRRWRAFIRNAKRLHEGDAIDFGNTVSAIASDRNEDGSFALTFAGDEPVELLLDRAGRMPLPRTETRRVGKKGVSKGTIRLSPSS